MPTTNTVTASYSGEDAGKYISASLLSGVTIAQSGISLMPNVKYQSALKTIDVADIIQDASCDFVDTGSTNVGERLITPKRLKVNMQLCKEDYRESWDAVSMGYSAHDSLAKNFSDYIIGEIAGEVAKATEINIWRGVEGTGAFDGFVTLLTADGGADVTGAAPTAATIADVMQEALEAVSNDVYGHDDLFMYIGQADYRLYVQYLGQVGTGQGYENKSNLWLPNVSLGENGLTFNGVRLFVTNGLQSGSIIVARKSNLFFGTGVMGDWNEVRLIDQEMVDGSDNVNVVMKFTAACQYGFRGDIVLRSNV